MKLWIAAILLLVSDSASQNCINQLKTARCRAILDLACNQPHSGSIPRTLFPLCVTVSDTVPATFFVPQKEPGQ